MFRPQDPPNRYKPNTLIGNWFEERVLEKNTRDESQFGKYSLDIKTTKDFSKSSEVRQTSSMMKASLSFLPECQGLKNGMRLRIENQTWQTTMAINTSDKRKTKLGVCGSKTSQAVRRNVFQIEKVVESPIENSDEVIRFGDKIRIATCSRLFEGILLYLNSSMCLFNQPMTPSAHQEVFFSMNVNFDSVWQILNVGFENRFKGVQNAVVVGEEFLLKHCATGKLMAVGGLADLNQFGKEFEVFVDNVETRNKSQNLVKEMIGLKGAEQINKDFGEANKWRFVSAKNSFEDFDEGRPDGEINGLVMLEELVDRVLQTGPFTFILIRDSLRKIDSNNTGVIDPSDFFWSLKNCGVKVTDSEFQLLLNLFPVKQGEMSYAGFFEQFQVFESTRKLELVETIVATITRQHSVLRFENLIKLFKCPDNNEEVNLFVRCWSGKKVVDLVSEVELKEFFNQVGVCVRTEDQFCEFLRRFVK